MEISVWCELGLKAGSHRKDYERIKLKTGEDYEILGQTFSNSFKKQDFQTILERYYLRLDNTGAWAIEVYPSLLCNWVSEHVDLYIKLKLVIFSFI